jgi:hypothetical protein
MSLFDEQFEDLKKQYPNAEAKSDESGGMNIKIPDAILPPGWNKSQSNIFFKVPVGYPVAKPDCFWVDADVRLASGEAPQNSGFQPIPPESEPKLWFSWHADPWLPNRDTLRSYVGVILSRLSVNK